MVEPHIAIRLDAEDRALLDACAAKEKLTKSDIIRRAIRKYAADLGIDAESVVKRGRKTKR